MLTLVNQTAETIDEMDILVNGNKVYAGFSDVPPAGQQVQVLIGQAIPKEIKLIWTNESGTCYETLIHVETKLTDDFFIILKPNGAELVVAQ